MRTCRSSHRTGFRVPAAFLLLAVSGSMLRGAFAVDPADEERVAGGGEPAFLSEIERASRLGEFAAVTRRPARQELPGTLLARVVPVQRRMIATASVQSSDVPAPDAGPAEGRNATWHVVAFLASLAVAGFAFRRFSRTGMARG